MPDYFEKKIDILLEAYKEASARTKRLVLTMSVAVATCVICLFNSTPLLFPLDKAEKASLMQPLVCDASTNQTPFDKELLTQTEFFKLPILGTKVFTADLGVMCSLAMIIL